MGSLQIVLRLLLSDDEESVASEQEGHINLDILATDNLQAIQTEITKAIEQSKPKAVEDDKKLIKVIDNRHECPDCLALFHNVNNYQLHRNLHFSVPIHGPPADGGGQRLRWAGYVENRGREYFDYSFYVCAELVDQLVDSLQLPPQI